MSYVARHKVSVMLVLLVAAAGPLHAQEAKALARLPEALDVMLAQGMQSNPEVLLAEARLAQARAELNQVRLKVTQEIIEVHAHRQALRSRIQGVHQRMKEAKQLYTNGMLPQGELRKEQITLIESQGALTSTDAEIRYLLGMGGMAAVARGQESAPIRKALPLQRPPVPPHFAVALDFEIAMHFENVSLKTILQNLSKASGVAILFHPEFGDPEWTLSLDFGDKPVPLRQLLLAIADLNGSLCFAVRDYGLLVVDRHDAEQMPCPVIPETIPLRP